MQIIMFIAVGIFIVVVLVSQKGRHQNKIEEQIRSIGGDVINIERRGFFSGLGPFKVVGKGRIVYRIEYRIGNDSKEGWVRFGGLLGPDWRL